MALTFATATATVNVSTEPRFSERLHSYLESHPERRDVTFAVGPNKTLVKAVRLILVVSSAELQKLFEEQWDEAVAALKEGEGVPLPDFEPGAFEIFLRLLPSEHVTEETFEKLNLSPDHILSLCHITNKFGMTKMHTVLKNISQPFYENFKHYVETPAFLSLSQQNLKAVLASDSIPMEEDVIFQWTCKWAEHQCRTQNLEQTPEALRNVLGDVLFEIRFPLMTLSDLSLYVFPKKILTADEKSNLFEYFALDEVGKMSFDATKLGFKTRERALVVAQAHVCSTLLIFTESQISTIVPFECDGLSVYRNSYYVNRKIEIIGLGFLGPIDMDYAYYIKVQPHILINDSWTSCGWTEKRIRAKRRTIFYFIFDTPVVVCPYRNNSTRNNVVIDFNLLGPPTQSLALDFNPGWSHEMGQVEFDVKQDGVRFHCRYWSRQLVELLFNKI